MEKCVLLCFFIFCSCIILSTQMFGMEVSGLNNGVITLPASDKELSWQHGGYDIGMVPFCVLDNLGDLKTVMIEGGGCCPLNINIKSLLNVFSSACFKSQHHTNVLNDLVKVTKKDGNLKLKLLENDDEFKKKYRQKISICKILISLYVCSYDFKDLYIQDANVQGNFFVDFSSKGKIPTIKAIGSTIHNLTATLSCGLELNLSRSIFNEENPKIFYVEAGKVNLNCDGSVVCLKGSKKTIFMGNVRNESVVKIYGDEHLNTSLICCDNSSKLFITCPAN